MTPTKTSGEAISLLLERFPMVLQQGETLQDLIQMGSHYAYGVFARKARENLNSREFAVSLGEFINELAQSGDALLEDLLITTVLETLGEDPEGVSAVKPHLAPKAREMMRQVEEGFFGRRA